MCLFSSHDLLLHRAKTCRSQIVLSPLSTSISVQTRCSDLLRYQHLRLIHHRVSLILFKWRSTPPSLIKSHHESPLRQHIISTPPCLPSSPSSQLILRQKSLRRAGGGEASTITKKTYISLFVIFPEFDSKPTHLILQSVVKKYKKRRRNNGWRAYQLEKCVMLVNNVKEAENQRILSEISDLSTLYVLADEE
ncbi:unnamed protein product [Vicia faba]|uniref:Uncharacterized protein n=1 Tax=Vicia faba TaxID=3906 RepID=A0AAV1AC34_VICFA|nr:unnamed protein product [Vicia faba]